MSDATLQLKADVSAIRPVIDELTEIAARRGSLPEFRQRLLEIVEALPGGIETRRVDLKPHAAHASQCVGVVALEFRQSFLDRVAALRALDRDLDRVGQ